MNDFLKFFPGADFLKSAAMGQAGSLGADLWSKWLMPTLDIKDIERRIGELRTVHFWLEQNSKSLALAIQTLEAQKMSLEALNAFHAAGGAEKPAQPAATEAQESPTAPESAATPTPTPAFDPAQAWSDLSQQFSRIAATAMGSLQAQPSSPAPAPEPRKKPKAQSKPLNSEK